MSSTITIDTDVLASRDRTAILEFAAQALQAATNAYASGEVTYIVSDGQVIAAISPVAAGERYEHANEVMLQPQVREETIPARGRASRRRFRWGPFEGAY